MVRGVGVLLGYDKRYVNAIVITLHRPSYRQAPGQGMVRGVGVLLGCDKRYVNAIVITLHRPSYRQAPRRPPGVFHESHRLDPSAVHAPVPARGGRGEGKGG